MIPPVSVVVAIQITGVTCQKHNAKFYVPVATLSINENIKFLENINQGFKEQFLRTNIDLKKQQKLKNNNLNCLIDLTFRNVDSLFVVSFKNGDMILRGILLTSITSY